MRSDTTYRNGQYLPWSQCPTKHFKYIQPVVTVWICVLISDAMIPEICFCGIYFVILTIILFLQNAWFLCALLSNVTVFCLLALKKTLQNTLWKRQVCTKFIDVIIENNQSHKSRVNSTLYNIATKGLPLSSYMFILTSPVYFTVMKCPSATSMYFSVFTSDPGTKSEISSVMWQVTPESKIQLVSCELSPKSVLGLSTL